ncbi:MAG: amidase, partial [Bdellovibrionales bacterium]|nr:amidase [Bdellovibrionales bacterium]
SAKQLASQHRAGTKACTESLRDKLKLIKSHNPKINALVSVESERATSEATRLDKLAKESTSRLGRLHGLAFSAKLNIDVANFPTSDGSATRPPAIAKHNNRLVELLTQEGAFCIGKGNMPEYGKSTFVTSNKIYGQTNNPFHLGYVPGGSTGGDAAALAAGFCDFSIGGDSGGSLRVPANFCGIFGMLPTHGTISAGPANLMSGTFTRTFGSSGPLARNLDDLELLYAILSGFNPADSSSVPSPTVPNESATKKFAYYNEIDAVHADFRIQKTLKETVEKFESLGYQGVEICPAPIVESLEPFVILAGQASLLQEDIIAQRSGNPRKLERESDIIKALRSRIKAELPPLTAETLLHFQYEAERVRSEMNVWFKGFDFIICPTAACTPPKHHTQSFFINGNGYESYQVFHFARAFNLLQLPAIAFPTSIGDDGLPLGLQIAGPRFSDRKLFQILRAGGFTNCIPSPSLSNNPQK